MTRSSGSIAAILICIFAVSTLFAQTTNSADTFDLLVAPPNDNFTSAASGIGAQIGVNGTTIDATKETNEPNHAGNVGGKSVWYTTSGFPQSAYGLCAIISPPSTNFDTIMAVYTGAIVSALTPVVSNDDWGSDLESKVCWPHQPGIPYKLAVDGFNGASGNFRISEDYNRAYLKSTRFAGVGGGGPAFTVFRPSNGTWYTSGPNGISALQWGQAGDIPVPADYDGDHITDHAVFRPSNGTWYVLRSSSGLARIVNFGTSGDKPVPGDYNGDGFDDFAVFRASEGMWYIQSAKNGVFTAVQFGQNGDKPVANYYDGDSKMDIAVFRPSTGAWYFLNSFLGNFTAVQWGVSTDIPVPGEYGVNNQDGKADIAIWRPSTGTWYALRTDTGALVAKNFGANGDIPQPLDHFGFGSTFDYGVFRPSNSTWYIETSTGTFSALQFGTAGDIPVSTFYSIQQ